MSFFFGKKQKVKPEYTSIQGQTSTSALCVPLVWGAARIAPNMIWYGDFKAVKSKQKTGKGFSPSITTYTYTASVQMGLCQGPITSVARVWKDQERKGSYTELGMTLFTGTYPQTPWGYLTTNHPTKALGYPGTAHLDVANYNLGNANTFGNHTFEVRGLRFDTQVDGDGDADPALIIQDLLTDPHFGAGFPAEYIDEDSLFSSVGLSDGSMQTYCRVFGFGMSPALTDVEPAVNLLQKWCDILNIALVWTGYSLKFIPRDALGGAAHGATYDPTDLITVRYTLFNSMFLADNEDPIILTRMDPADAKNSYRLAVIDRANEYNAVPIQWKDQALIDRFGLKPAGDINAPEITSPYMASRLIAIYGQRNAWRRNEFRCKVPIAYCRLEPMDVVVCVDRNMGTFSCRVKEIEEDDEDNLQLLLEDFPEGIGSAPAPPTEAPSNTPINTGTDPGPINSPILFEPRSDLTGGIPQVWAAVSGGDGSLYDPNWGGCYVWLSTDGGVQYQQIGQIDSAARMGKLTATLDPYGGSNPDTGNVLSVNLSPSNGELEGVTSAEAANSVTLSIVTDGSQHELLSYMDAVLTAPLEYDLEGELYRNLYGTLGYGAGIGDDFARLDDNIFKFNLPKNYIGDSIYLKFQSFNIWNQGLEDLSGVTPYTYTPVGTGFGGGTGGVPTEPTGLSAVSSGPQQVTLQWNANPSTDAVQVYKLYRGLGAAVPFGSTAVIATVTGQYFLDATVDADEDYTYFLVATNTVGDSDPEGPEIVTTSSIAILQQIYLPSTFVPDLPTSSQVILYHKFAEAATFPANFAGSQFGASANATGSTVFTIWQADALTPNTFTQIGTITVAGGGVTGVFASTGGTPKVFGVGDELKVVCPVSPDATLANPHASLLSNRI